MAGCNWQTYSFNPRPRVGGDHGGDGGPLAPPVSTHAPAWGATFPLSEPLNQCGVSTHAPAWGATMS